jgi:tRNA(fMet)-specific endonuclease VapC
MHCLDTNAAIAVLRGRPRPLIERFRTELVRGSIGLPAIVLFELHYGAARSDRREENEDRLATFLSAPIAVLPFDGDDAREAGNIRALLTKAGTPIGPYDILIAAQARRRGALLVTANEREFARVPGLRCEDWTMSK